MKIELKEALSSCSHEERTEAAVFLRVLERLQDPDYHELMRQRSTGMRAGRNVMSGEKVVDLDGTLQSHGI